jgi:hypothetical protein
MGTAPREDADQRCSRSRGCAVRADPQARRECAETERAADPLRQLAEFAGEHRVDVRAERMNCMAVVIGSTPEGESAAALVPHIESTTCSRRVTFSRDAELRARGRGLMIFVVSAVIGATLGRTFVARFAPTMLRYHEAVSAVENTVELPTGLSLSLNDPSPIALFRAIRAF